MGLGLSEGEIEVYVLLSSGGPQKAPDIACVLKMYEREIKQILEHLKIKGIVTENTRRPLWFEAIPFEKALDLLLKAHLKEARQIEQNKIEMLSQWKALAKKDPA